MEERANVSRLPFLLSDDDKYDGKQPFRTYYGMKYLGGYSDHLPIYTDFEAERKSKQFLMFHYSTPDPSGYFTKSPVTFTTGMVAFVFFKWRVKSFASFKAIF